MIISVNFKAGDYVELTNPGQIYGSYEDKAIELKATNWRSGHSPKFGQRGYIVALGEDLNQKPLALIDFGAYESIVGLLGLTLAQAQTTTNFCQVDGSISHRR